MYDLEFCLIGIFLFKVKGSSVLEILLPLSWSSPPEVFLGKGVLQLCSKFTKQLAQLCNLQSNFIEITLRHGFSPVNVLYIFRISFPKNIFGRLLLYFPSGFLILVSMLSCSDIIPPSYNCCLKSRSERS